MKGIIIYGPPASGKDTVTAALVAADPRCELFPRLKCGPGKMSTYRPTSREQIDELRAKGDIAWENNRYGATYAVDTPELLQRLTRGIPVLHLGQVEAIQAVRRATPKVKWTVVALWCPRPLAIRRLTERNPLDLEQRLQAWDETDPAPPGTLLVNTSHQSPAVTARTILRLVDGQEEGDPD